MQRTQTAHHSVPFKDIEISCIRLTGKCQKHSEESQEGCIRPGHLQLCVWKCWEIRVKWQTSRERWVCERWGGSLGEYWLLVRGERGRDCTSDKRLNPTNREGFQGAGRCWGFNFDLINLLCSYNHLLSKCQGLLGSVSSVTEEQTYRPHYRNYTTG